VCLNCSQPAVYFVIQLPEDGLHSKVEHFREAMISAARLHTKTKGHKKVVQVDAI
jgi:hypothetical protein